MTARIVLDGQGAAARLFVVGADLAQRDADLAGGMAGQRARTVVALAEIRVRAIVERDRGDVEQAIAVVRERYGGGRRRTVERLIDHDRGRTECDQGSRGVTLEGDQLLAPDRIVGNHDAAGVGAESGARLKRDLEGTDGSGLESRLGAGVLEG